MNSYEIVEEYDGIIRVLERTENSPPTGYSESYLRYRNALDDEDEEEEEDIEDNEDNSVDNENQDQDED